MTKRAFKLLTVVLLTALNISVLAQAPNISYTPSSYVYTAGTTITNITPGNTGGAVPADYYGNVTNIAGGNLVAGHTDATGGSARFSDPESVAVDQLTGNIYITDFNYNCIRKMTPAGVVTTFAGRPITGTSNTPNDGTGTAANFNGPNGIIINSSNTILYVTDNFAIRQIVIATAAVTTLAGNGTTSGSTNATGTAASFNVPVGMALNTLGTILYIADWKNNEIRQLNLATNAVTTFAGSTTAGYTNGSTGATSAYNSPYWLGYDASGNFLLVDKANNVVRSVNSSTGATTNFVGSTSGTSGYADATGTSAMFNFPKCIVKDGAGNYYVSDNLNNRVRKITPAGVVTTLAGSGTAGNTAGVGTAASFNGPFGLGMENSTSESGYIYCVDQTSNTIRKISINGYLISPTLPAGLSFDNTTGTISGTPTTPQALTTYTVTAYNYYGSSSCTISITINPVAPTVLALVQCGSTGTLTASGGSPTGGTYNWYSASSGGTLLQSSTSASYIVAATGTYYVSYTVNGATSATRTAGSATINPIVSTPITGSEVMYPFSGNIASANAVDDVSGNNDPLIPYPTAATGPTLSADRYSAASCAYTFDGSTQYLATTKSFINPTTFTLSLWFKTTTTSGGKLIGFDQYQTTSGQFDRHIYMTNSGQLIFGIYNSGTQTITSPISYNDGYWHHVVVTLSSTAGSVLYVDGISVASSATMTVPEPHNGYWRIGYDNLSGWPSAPTSYYFAGQIDDVSIYDRALSAAEVSTSHNLNLMGNVASCPGNSVTFQAQPINGATYSWTDGTNTVTGNPATFSSSIIGNYTLTVTGGPGGCSSTAVVSCGSGDIYTWTGATSTDPTIATNWNYTTQNISNQVPPFDGTASIVIPTGLTNYPVLTASESVFSLTLGNNATFTLGGFTLSVGCNIYNNATGSQVLYGSNSSSGITWNGSVSNQYFYGSTTAGSGQTGNMTINNSAAGTVNISSGVLDVYNTVTLTKGNLKIAASPVVFTLKSTSTLTASVAAIPSSYSVTGNVTAERYITGGGGHRTYRLISSPVYNATISSTYNVYSLNYVQNSVWLTGSSGGGFDKTGNPTLYLYREDQIPSNATFTSGNFWGISAINNSPSYNYYLNNGSTVYNIPVGNGVMFFFRGNKASASLATETQTSYTTPVAVALSTTGTLTQGQVVIRNWYTPNSTNIAYSGSGSGAGTNSTVRGFNLVGNPYASSIDWSKFSNSSSAAAIYGVNVGPSIWTFDPTTKNYATYNATTNISTGNGGKIIASGQGFFVQATTSTPTAPSLTFQEAAKTSTQPTAGSTLLMSTHSTLATLQQSAYNSYLRLKMVTDSVNYSDVVIGFNSTSNTKFNPLEDSRFVWGMGTPESVAAVSADSINASAKWVPLPKSNLSQVVKLYVWAQASGTYTFNRTDFNSIPAIYDVWLMDGYKKDSLDLRNNTTYSFDVNPSDTSTYGNNRFTVVIRENPARSIHLLNFTAAKASIGSQVTWTTENEQNYTAFTVERSTDGGKTFNVLGGFQSDSLGTYSFLDKNPLNGANMYRLKIEDLNGSITYSGIVTLMYGNGATLVKTGIVIYPNPAKSTLNLSIAPGFSGTSTTPPTYNIKVTNILGSIIKQTTTLQTWQTDVSALMPGTYVIQVTHNNGGTVDGEGTFIKL